MDPIWVFPFLERHSLEKSQLVCKLWHRIIDENHEQLALRTLDYYWLNLEERKRQKLIHHPSFLRYQDIAVECKLREIIHFAAKSGECVVTGKLDDRVMRLCKWGAFLHLRNAYVKELKLDGSLFSFGPLTAVKATLGGRSSLRVDTLVLEKLSSIATPRICWLLRDSQALFKYDTVRFDNWRPCNYSKVVAAVSCSAMMFHCPVTSARYLTELLKRAKCSILTIVDSRIKANVCDLIQTIRSLHPPLIPEELCVATHGNYDFDSEGLDASFDFLSMKESAVSMTPVQVEQDNIGKNMAYRCRFSSDVDRIVLEATIGLRIKQRWNGLSEVLVRKFQYRFFREEYVVQPRLNPGNNTQFQMPIELFLDVFENLNRKDVDSCQLVSTALNGRIMTLSSVLPLHPLEYFRMDFAKFHTYGMASYSLAYSYHFADSSVRDVRIFDRLEKTDDPRSTAKIHLAFAHFRNTYIREAFPNAPTTKFFCRYFADDFNANIGSVHLNRPDHCEIALRFSSVSLAVGNATIVVALIERFKQLEDTSKVPSSFTLHTEPFGVSEVFRSPSEGVRVTEEPASASAEPSSSTATCMCHRRQIRNVHTGNELEVCLTRPSNRCGVTTVTFNLVVNLHPI